MQVKLRKRKNKMTRQKNQLMKYNDQELELLRVLFKDNEDLLFVIRKVFLQFDLEEAERKMLDNIMNDKTFALLKKIFLPELDPDAPLFQMTDLILTLKYEMEGKESSALIFQAKQIEMDYLAQQLEVLKDEKAEQKIKLSELAKLIDDERQIKDAYELIPNITARNWLLSKIDTEIRDMKILSQRSAEQNKYEMKKVMEAMKKNSNK